MTGTIYGSAGIWYEVRVLRITWTCRPLLLSILNNAKPPVFLKISQRLKIDVKLGWIEKQNFDSESVPLVTEV